MDLSWLVRMRWRLRGAWMWPAFVVLAVADGIIGHLLPVAGNAESVVGGLIAGLFFNLLAVVVLGPLVGRLLRTRRRDLPLAIARDYGGATCIALVTVALLAIGAARQGSIVNERRVTRDAATRAAAWIGDHAPARFQADASRLDTYVLVAGSIYRVCAGAGDDRSPHYFCVIVDERRPAAQSVRPAGSESNETLSRGAD
jgi:hypothetical protein